MFDLVIKNGMVVDGTGVGGRQASIGIRDGVIAAVGDIDEDAVAATIDASGRVIAPGFIDIHTHYDAQAFWDGMLSPSSFHGVTTVVGGNCGFSIAPLADAASGEYLMRMLARVEGMPLESLLAGVPWDWSTFGEFLDSLEGRLAVNAGFLVGHSALRRSVMGERAVGCEASDDEIDRMRELLASSLRDGGLGFSTSTAPTHNDADGNPVPSRHATTEEILALGRVVRDHPGTTVECLPGLGIFTDEQKALMTDLSLAANRPVNWNVLSPSSGSPEVIEGQLAASDHARQRGAEVVALTVPQPMTVRINFISGFVFDALPGWQDLFKMPMPKRIEALENPEYRAGLDQQANSEEAGMMRGLAQWQRMTVDQVTIDANRQFQGRTIGSIAEELGKAPFDAMVDLALSEDLRVGFRPPSSGDDDESWRLRGEAWHDDRTVVGASDAGAHLDMIDTFAFSTRLLGDGVRERGLISLEEGVRQLTDIPARLYGITNRGRIQEGWLADLVVFDPDTIASGPIYTALRPPRRCRSPVCRRRWHRPCSGQRPAHHPRPRAHRGASGHSPALRARYRDRRGARRPCLEGPAGPRHSEH